MENQTPTTTSKRPMRRDQAVVLAAATSLAKKVCEWLKEEGDEAKEPAIIGDLVDAMKWGDCDGYELAKDLERAGYAPDARLVEILDDAVFAFSRAHDKAQREWVKANAITPKFKAGDEVSFTYNGKPTHGIIQPYEEAHYFPEGKYAIVVAGMNGRPIIAWEDVTAFPG